MPPTFDQVYAAQREPTLALCLHLTGNRTLAEEAFQETFLLVHQHLAGFRGESKVGTWVYTIALRAASRVRERERSQLLKARALGDQPRAEPHPDAMGLGDAEALYRAMDRLSEDDRTLLALLAVRGLTSAQAGDVLGIPTGTVYSRAFAARSALRRLMGTDAPSPGPVQ